MNLEDIPSTQDFDRLGLLKHVLDQFKISRDGDHGPGHWARVRLHGLKVGGVRGADLLVVELFAFLHDSQRLNEYSDPLHGARAADFAASLNGQFFDLKAGQLDKLCHAMQHHSGGEMCIPAPPFSLAGMVIDWIWAGWALSRTRTICRRRGLG